MSMCVTAGRNASPRQHLLRNSHHMTTSPDSEAVLDSGTGKSSPRLPGLENTDSRVHDDGHNMCSSVLVKERKAEEDPGSSSDREISQALRNVLLHGNL